MSTASPATSVNQISKDHAVFVEAVDGDVPTITVDHRLGTDPDYIHIYGPDGKLQTRAEIPASATDQVTSNSGSGAYKILPVNYAYIHDYSIPGSRRMVVEPFDHEELLRVTSIADLYFNAPGKPAAFLDNASALPC